MRSVSISALILFTTSGWLAAEEPKPIELLIEGRAIESPVLKYRLLPAEAEIKPGNAVPILLRLPWDQTPWMTQVFPKLDDWNSRPLTSPEWKEFEGVFPDRFYNEMMRAAFRRDANWEYPVGEVASPYLIFLPDVQGLRGLLGQGLSAKIRYHLSRGEMKEAREGILVGLANSRHIANTPFYICQFVAMAIHRRMLERTDEMISLPNSPNLYWALTTLPDSLLKWDRTASFESDMFRSTFPAVDDLDRSRDAKEWTKMSEQLVDFLEFTGDLPQKTRLANLAQKARGDLPEMLGISEQKVAAMSDDEASLRWYAYLRISNDQHMSAVLALSPREAWPELRKLQTEWNRMYEKVGTKPEDYFNPISVYVGSRSLNRKIQAMRIIEAVRNYVAKHDSKLPRSLDEIKDVPIPVDPLTDQPFGWIVDGNKITLKAPPLPTDILFPVSANAAAAAHALEYRLELKPQ